jgi:hypothetical protein
MLETDALPGGVVRPLPVACRTPDRPTGVTQERTVSRQDPVRTGS